MSFSIVSGFIWVVIAAMVAMVPMPRQIPPGLALLAAAPLLLGWMAWEHGLWVVAFGLFALVSMFRNPLRFLLRRVVAGEEAGA